MLNSQTLQAGNWVNSLLYLSNTINRISLINKSRGEVFFSRVNFLTSNYVHTLWDLGLASRNR